MANLSLEQAHFVWSNRGVDPFGKRSRSLPPQARSNILPIDRLHLSPTPAARVVIEYEDGPNHLSVYDVSLTCSGETAAGRLYLGGYATGKFRIFRADHIHRAVLI